MYMEEMDSIWTSLEPPQNSISHLVAGNLTDNVSLNLLDNVESLSASLSSSAQEPANQKS